ncbi:hypothetical protein BDN70DRAFT_870382 [Pholiota conissans]|uniref:Uncharacterized protein n=1 Tax=Pholiota conissans TaxID=109636 RepID=A0A9P5ZGM3_9AGAR|nr:hypothetical protein BDN70DRAFT_870382 [Pholiota conissans]
MISPSSKSLGPHRLQDSDLLGCVSSSSCEGLVIGRANRLLDLTGIQISPGSPRLLDIDSTNDLPALRKPTVADCDMRRRDEYPLSVSPQPSVVVAKNTTLLHGCDHSSWDAALAESSKNPQKHSSIPAVLVKRREGRASGGVSGLSFACH